MAGKCIACVLLLVACTAWAGCSRQRTGTSDPEAKLRLEGILEGYKAYIHKYGKGPPDEATFLAYLRKLPADQKEALRIADDLDTLLTSPRDGQKYVIRYKMSNLQEGDTRAVAWEKTGGGGRRWVALSVGYVEECDDEYFNELQQRK